jgi:hypothetical protein
MSPLVPLLLGGIAIVLGLVAGVSHAGSDLPVPSRRRGSVVTFRTRRAFWRKNPKTGEDEFRTEVVDSPADLALAASRRLGRKGVIGMTPFLLATLMASEAGSLHPLGKVAVAHAALNMARSKRTTLLSLLAPNGKLGSQHGRYASTRLPPSESEIMLAEGIDSQRILDPTRGAVQFDSPSAQEKLSARGEAGYDRGADEIAARRRKSGKELVTLPGIPVASLRLWRPVA